MSVYRDNINNIVIKYIINYNEYWRLNYFLNLEFMSKSIETVKWNT